MTDTIEITIDDEYREVQFSRLGTLSQMFWVSRMPQQLQEMSDPNDLRMTEDIMQYFVDLIKELTDLDDSDLEKTTQRGMEKLIEASAYILAGQDIDIDEPTKAEDFKVSGGAEFGLNEDGAVDLEDWR